MKIDDYVFVIKPDDPFYGQKCIICAVQTDFSGKITGYTVSRNGDKHDYAPEDVQYTTKLRRTITPQMQLL